MLKNLFLFGLAIAFISGCASVPLESKEISDKMKQFGSPDSDKAGLYVYRDTVLGAALKKDIYINEECLGETGPKTFFYEQVDGNKTHKISTESEFSPNDLTAYFEAGKNYFVNQFIKLGLLVGGADLELVDEETGKNAVAALDLAKKGQCGSKYK